MKEEWLWLQQRNIESNYSLGYYLGYFTDVQILFGDQKVDHIVNKIIIASKYLIFKQKTKTSAVTFQKLLYYLKSESEIKRSIATNNNQFKKFWGLWSPIWKSIKNPAHYIWTTNIYTGTAELLLKKSLYLLSQIFMYTMQHIVALLSLIFIWCLCKRK